METEDSSLRKVRENPPPLWNSAESNREPEKGSRIGPDVVACTEAGLGSRWTEQHTTEREE